MRTAVNKRKLLRKISLGISIPVLILMQFIYGRMTPGGQSANAQAVPTPVAKCVVYGVDDEKTTKSQFFYIDSVTGAKTNFGTAYNADAFESMDMDPLSKIIYSVANNNATTPFPTLRGHLYQIDAVTGKAFDVGNTGLHDVEALSFRPGEPAYVWLWDEQVGLYRVDKNNPSSKTFIKASPTSLDFQGMAWNNAGTLLYISSEDGKLWEYNPVTNNLITIATNLPIDNDSLEMRPDNLIMTMAEGSANITLIAYNPITKSRVTSEDIVLHTLQYDSEGLVWPEWCGNPRNPTPPTPTPLPTAPNFPSNCNDPASIMLVLDASGSMREQFSPSETRLQAIRRILPRFVDKIDFSRDKVGIVNFNKTATASAPLGSTRDKILSTIATYPLNDSTNIPDGIKIGGDQLLNATGRKYIILITDGINTKIDGMTVEQRNQLSIDNANIYKSQGTVIAALGLAEADLALMQGIASPYLSDPSRRLAYLATNSTQLEEFYKVLEDTIQCSNAPTSTVSMTCNTAIKPVSSFRVNVDIAINVKPGSRATEAYAVLAPASPGNLGFTYSAGVVNGPKDSAILVPATGTGGTANYAISATQFITTGNPHSLKFGLDYRGDTSFYRNFNGKFDLYLYVKEINGYTNLVSGQMPKVVSGYAFDALETCAKIYYTTYGGDLRSVEQGAYASTNLGGDVNYGQSGNKMWRAKDSTNTKFQAYDNDAETYGFAKTGTYTFETYGSIKPRSSVNAPRGFSLDIDATFDSLKRDKNILKDLVGSINGAVTSKTLNQLLINSNAAMTNFPTTNFSRNVGQKSITVQLAGLTQENLLIVIDDQDFPNVYIQDAIANTPEKVIIWCKTKSCNLKVGSVSLVDFNGSQNYKASLQNALKSKSRIYLNYLANEPASTPIDQEFTYNGSTIPSTRKIEFVNNGNTDRSSFYLGAMMTNGYVYSSQSKKTDVVYGMILARGIVASGSNEGVRNLYFKDYGNPFIYIDYDAKYPIAFSKILAPYRDTQKPVYIGL